MGEVLGAARRVKEAVVAVGADPVVAVEAELVVVVCGQRRSDQGERHKRGENHHVLPPAYPSSVQVGLRQAGG